MYVYMEQYKIVCVWMCDVSKFLIVSLLDSFALLLILVRAHLLALFFCYFFFCSPLFCPLARSPSPPHNFRWGFHRLSFAFISMSHTCSIARSNGLLWSFWRQSMMLLLSTSCVCACALALVMLSMVFDALWYNHLVVFMDGWIWSVRAMCVYFEFAYLIEKHSNRNYEWKYQYEKRMAVSSITSNKRVCMQDKSKKVAKGVKKYVHEIDRERKQRAKCKEKSELR